MAKNALTFFFFVLGATLVFVRVPGLNELLLLLDAILLGFLLFDLNVPKRVAGISGPPRLRFLFSIYGAIFMIAFSAGAVGYLIAITILLVTVLVLPHLLWQNVDWTASYGRVQKTFTRLQKTEAKKDLQLEEKNVRLLRTKTLRKIDFLKILSLTVHLLKVWVIVMLLSGFVSALGYNYFMELGLLVLFVLWASLAFWNLIVKRRFKSLWKKKEKVEENTWTLLAQQFLSPRGILYLSFFVPAVLMSIVAIFVTASFSVQLILSTFRVSMQWYIIALSYMVVSTILFCILVSFTYPFYVILKLFAANANRKSRGGYKKEIYILPSPLLCLSASLVFAIMFNLPENVLNLCLFGFVSFGIMYFIGAVAVLAIVWTRAVVLRRKGARQELSAKLENQLAVAVSITTLSFYRFLGIDFILGFCIFFALLLYLSEVFITIEQEKNHKSRFTIETFAIFSIVAAYSYFFMPEFTWIAPMCASACCLVLIGWMPDRFSTFIISHLLMIEEIKVTSSCDHESEEE